MMTFSREKTFLGNEKIPRDLLLSNVEKFLVGTFLLEQTFLAIISFLALLENCKPFETLLQLLQLIIEFSPFSLFPSCHSVSCYSILSRTTFVEIRGWKYEWKVVVGKSFRRFRKNLKKQKRKRKKFSLFLLLLKRRKKKKVFSYLTHLASLNHHNSKGMDNHWLEKWKEIF